MIEVGRMCIKTAGRDAGMKCVIVDLIGGGLVIVDGQTRRRKCNVRHLEPLAEIIKIKKGASRQAVFEEFKRMDIPVKETKPRKAAERPKKEHVRKVKHVKPDTAKQPEKTSATVEGAKKQTSASVEGKKKPLTQ